VQAFASVLSPAEQRSMRDSIIQDEDVLDTWFSSALCVPVVRLPLTIRAIPVKRGAFVVCLLGFL
jgi:hypothetical protein